MGNVMVSSAAGVTVSQYESGGMVCAAGWEATLVLQCKLDAGGDALQFCIGPCFINMYPSMVIVIGNTVTNMSVYIIITTVISCFATIVKLICFSSFI